MRSVGPDSQLHGLRIDLAVATVGEMRAALAPLLQCRPEHLQIFLRVPGGGGGPMAGGGGGPGSSGRHPALEARAARPHCVRGGATLADDAAALHDLGVRLEPNGCCLYDLHANVVTMIS